MRGNELLHCIRVLAAGGHLQLVEALRRGNRKDRHINHSATPFLPIRWGNTNAEASHAHHCIRGIRIRGGEVEASHTEYWPGMNTCALESTEPLPFASNVPVKQMPLAWLRRWPSAGPPGGAK